MHIAFYLRTGTVYIQARRIHNRSVFTMSTVLYVLYQWCSRCTSIRGYITFYMRTIVYMATPVYIVYMPVFSCTPTISYMYKRKITFTCTSFPTYSQYFLHASCFLFLDPRISPYNHVQCAFYTQTLLYVIVQKHSIFCRSTRSCLK
jgi:hypothetical protein